MHPNPAYLFIALALCCVIIVKLWIRYHLKDDELTALKASLAKPAEPVRPARHPRCIALGGGQAQIVIDQQARTLVQTYKGKAFFDEVSEALAVLTEYADYQAGVVRHPWQPTWRYQETGQDASAEYLFSMYLPGSAECQGFIAVRFEAGQVYLRSGPGSGTSPDAGYAVTLTGDTAELPGFLNNLVEEAEDYVLIHLPL